MVTTSCAPRDTAFWSADDYQPVDFNGDFGSFRGHSDSVFSAVVSVTIAGAATC